MGIFPLGVFPLGVFPLGVFSLEKFPSTHLSFIIFISKPALIYQKVLGVIRIDKMASFFFKGQILQSYFHRRYTGISI